MTLLAGRISRSIRADVLEAHYISLTGLAAVSTGDALKVLMTYGEDVATDPDNSWPKRWMIERCVPRADIIFTEDFPSRMRRLQQLGARPEQIVVHNWGTDLEAFHPSRRSDLLRARYVSDGESLVLSLRPARPISGLDGDQYDVSSLLRAIPEVVSERPSTHFLLLGDTPEAYHRLLSGAEELPNTTFGGRVPYNELPIYLASADLFVDTYHPQRDRALVSHNLGQGLMEAMASGTATLVADRIGIQEAPHYPGLCYDAGDASSLASGAMSLLADVRTREKVARKGRKVVENIYDWQANMAAVTQLYEQRLSEL